MNSISYTYPSELLPGRLVFCSRLVVRGACHLYQWVSGNIYCTGLVRCQVTGAIFFFEVFAAHQLLPFCPCACGVLITVAIGGPFFPSGWYPPHALGSLCRRGLLRDQIRKTSLYTLHAFFVFCSLSFIWKSISDLSWIRGTGWRWFLRCIYFHRIKIVK